MKKVRDLDRSGKLRLLLLCAALGIMVVLCALSSVERKKTKEAEDTAGSHVVSSAGEEAVELSLYAQAAVLMDGKTGRILYGKNQEEILPMASTTKIMTCILALERGNLQDEVEISSYAAGMPKVKLYVKAGETYKLQDLLYSLMLESHNDAAVAIAEHIGGSVQDFAGLMNEKALEIGCKNTHFITPNGLDATDQESGRSHSTTAEDLARIMAYCVEESPARDAFLQITKTAEYQFTNGQGRSFQCRNHNALLTLLEGAFSGKTGFTGKAGYCYVGAVKRDERLFIVALLACGWPNNKTYKWADCRTLFTYGYDTFRYHTIESVPELGTVPVSEGIPESGSPFETAVLPVQMEEPAVSLKLLLKDTDEVKEEIYLPKIVQAPIEEGEKVGMVRYTLNREPVAEYPVLAGKSIQKRNSVWIVRYIVQRFLL